VGLDHPLGLSLDHPLARAAFDVVTGLHVFFEAWLGGTMEKTPAGLSRLEGALADGFTLVTPQGARLKRSDVIESLRGAHGSRSGSFRIAILEPELLCLRPPLVVLGYVEEQGMGAAVTRRRSTAVFEECGDGRKGVRWLALHETWIAPGA
jgi:hypothetical protein